MILAHFLPCNLEAYLAWVVVTLLPLTPMLRLLFRGRQ